jgi:dihydroorotate dehydrogenase
MLKFLYKNVSRRFFFMMDPEKVHDRIVTFGNFLGKYSFTKGITRIFFDYKNDKLDQEINGMKFSNPVGLAAGFDKDGHLLKILPDVGFGFIEIGSVTGKSCYGNEKPRLWRMIKEESLIVNYGLKSAGCKKVARRFVGKREVPVAVSLAKTNNKDVVGLEEEINDYLDVYKAFKNRVDFFVVNISCPNTYGKMSFVDPKYLKILLERIYEIRNDKPIFVKLSPDLDFKLVDEIIDVCKKVDGFVCTNLTKKVEKENPGGVSGKLLFTKANDMVKHVYSKNTGKIIIGCGGISSAEDAYEMIKNGANVVQLITSMIYEGPSVVKDINKGLVRLMEKDGYKNISEAVGTK